MNKKLMALALLLSTTGVTAGEQDVLALELQVAAQVETVITASNGEIQPDALEEQLIKFSIVAREMNDTSATIDQMGDKYILDTAEKRTIVIVANSAGSGEGIKPQ